ncbi:IS1380 family transposase [Clostridium sp. 2-1]|uniref:IS1380 family transposase n=1 Tax=Clostridium TaxID=1485 RepID=UPI000CDA5A26|nr:MULTISPECIES: IS1380 family transposase [Clostridium]MBN7577203.1 IS1380 family transposase [Clostridium beijerinckii]MBN7581318.1 IS1380 family transposase [Clostridium beijerinckii]MBN7586969.1 IS1380 family transposase [Clostridium beijerinckii]MBO0523247.1 IS1380 family transposase [Clostridium beijerinckii]POO88958.1 IS1380 family transposase [Clostridium sp. 2-1]
MGSLLEKSLNFKRNVKINFDGGNLTSDSGLILYSEFDERIGFSRTVKDVFYVNDGINHREHTNEEILLQKVYQRIAGYTTDDNSDELRYDPALTTILDKNALASQPTISRFNNNLDKENLRQFNKINELVLDKVYSIDMPNQIILDIDSTNFETYGNQYGSAYNSHYSANGYHPLLVFDGLTGDLLKAELRSGNVYTSRKTVAFIGPLLKRYSNKYICTDLYIRGDSGFAIPGLYEIAEEHDAKYAIRLKANATLYKYSEEFTTRMEILCKRNIYDHYTIYGEFVYKAKKWTKERRVVVKLEKKEGQMCIDYTFVVTNMTSHLEAVIKFYCNRGTMENFIKEGKNGFAFDKMSSSSFIANANKLQEMVLAYNLNNWMRRLCFTNSMKSLRIETIRMKIIKVAGKLVKSSRYLKFKLCSSCAYQNEFWHILKNINSLPLLN